MCDEEPDLFLRRLSRKALLTALRHGASIFGRFTFAWPGIREDYNIHLELDSKMDVE
jgi:hypothetical protein